VRIVEGFKRRWMAFVVRLGTIQTTIVLFVIYAFVLGPVSLVMRAIARRDLLELRRPSSSTFAHPKRQIPTDPERCERQF
jgi:hypothetical protein